MSRKDDLEQSIRESYQLIHEYERIQQDTADPKEKRRAERAMAEQWELVKGYLSEYVPLCARLGKEIPPDIAEVAITARVSLPASAQASTEQTELVSLPALRRILTDYFNEGELRNLCFDLNIDYEGLPGGGKGDRARELVAYCERHGRTHELAQACRQLRPHVAGSLRGGEP